MNHKIEKKTFDPIQGKIVPESIFIDLKEEELQFNVKTGSDKKWYKTNDGKVITKFLTFHGISRRELWKQLKNEETDESGVNKFVRETVADKARTLVFLEDDNKDLTNVVSKKHTQVPLTDLYETVRELAKEKGFHIQSVNNNKVELLSGTSALMDSKVHVDLGRNDSKDGSAIRIRGGGNIFVCSNMIVAHVDRDIMTTAQDMGIHIPKVRNRKLIHTTGITERFKQQISQELQAAKDSGELLGKKLEESMKIIMDRQAQLKAFELIKIKHNLSTNVHQLFIDELFKHDQREPEHRETLYQFSQVITHIGTHYEIKTQKLREKFCRMGGQVVLLGKDFVKLMDECVRKKLEAKVR